MAKINKWQLFKQLRDKAEFALYGQEEADITEGKDNVTIHYKDGRRFIFQFIITDPVKDDGLEPE